MRLSLFCVVTMLVGCGDLAVNGTRDPGEDPTNPASGPSASATNDVDASTAPPLVTPDASASDAAIPVPMLDAALPDASPPKPTGPPNKKDDDAGKEH